MKRSAMWCVLVFCGAAQAQSLPGAGGVGPAIGGAINTVFGSFVQPTVGGLVQTGLNSYLLPAQSSLVSPMLGQLTPQANALLEQFPEARPLAGLPTSVLLPAAGAVATPLLTAVPNPGPLPGLP